MYYGIEARNARFFGIISAASITLMFITDYDSVLGASTAIATTSNIFMWQAIKRAFSFEKG